ncbi:hypothetical protein GCM10027601_21280 [Nocardioides ungokensis]
MGGRKTLAKHDVLFPRWRDQVDAVIDVLDIPRRPRPDACNDAWPRMVDQIRDWPGTALMSMEFLGPASAKDVQSVVRSFEGVPVEVVITARDLNRALMAMWQESAKNSGTETWPWYLKAVEEGTGEGKRFWRQQRLAVIVGRWAAAVDISNVTVVTVPPPGAPREILWSRFCEAVGTDPTWCPPVEPANESLGAAAAEVLRRVNADLADWDIPWPSYAKVVKSRFAKDVLGSLRGEDLALGMPVPEWIHHRAVSMRANVEATGVRVIGSLDELAPVTVAGVTPDEVPIEDQLHIATRALGHLLRLELERHADAAIVRREN